MHGRKKALRSIPESEEARAARIAKYAAYREASAKLVAAKDLPAADGREAQAAGERILRSNPDFATLWNSRRRHILKALREGEEEDGSGTANTSRNEAIWLERELALTKEQISEKNSKSYGAWHHRRWAIETLLLLGEEDDDDDAPQSSEHAAGVEANDGDGRKSGEKKQKRISEVLHSEIALCDALLKRDERNFHCWGYRNWLCERARVSLTESLAHSSALIAKNISNYSAWHLRAETLERALSSCENGESSSPTSSTEFTLDLRAELDLVHNAIFTEPADQSVWMYYRWLIGSLARLARAFGISRVAANDDEMEASLSEIYESESRMVQELLEEERADLKWPLIALLQLECVARREPGLDREGAAAAERDGDEARVVRMYDYCLRLERVDPSKTRFYRHLLQLLSRGGEGVAAVARVLFAGAGGEVRAMATRGSRGRERMERKLSATEEKPIAVRRSPWAEGPVEEIKEPTWRRDSVDGVETLEGVF